jgi:hypothetical protein
LFVRFRCDPQVAKELAAATSGVAGRNESEESDEEMVDVQLIEQLELGGSQVGLVIHSFEVHNFCLRCECCKYLLFMMCISVR